jgi:polysaccharide deacetylase 2 family uncharacterized protein YibQ
MWEQLSKLTISQIITIGLVLIAAIAAIAKAVRYVLGVRPKIKAGSIQVGECDCSMRDVIMETHRLVVDLVKANNLQTKRITALRRAMRKIIEALNYHSTAFKEVGANGSVAKALAALEKAKVTLDDDVDEASEAAMTTKEAIA